MLDERAPRTEPDRRGDPREIVVRVDPRSGRRGGFGAVVALALAGLLALVGVGAFMLWSSGFGLGDLFGTTTVDRSAPVLVERLRNRNEFRGATGTFSATVDLETKHGFIPTFVAGSHTIYSGVGDVDATVSLHKIAAATGTDGTVVLTLPHATVGAARLDTKLSHVMSRERGIGDRLGSVFIDSPTSDHGVERVAVQRIERAATQSRLRAKAEHNTERMIRNLAHAVGVDHVEVRFATTVSTQR